jgi:hypothetical protein
VSGHQVDSEVGIEIEMTMKWILFINFEIGKENHDRSFDLLKRSAGIG